MKKILWIVGLVMCVAVYESCNASERIEGNKVLVSRIGDVLVAVHGQITECRNCVENVRNRLAGQTSNPAMENLKNLEKLCEELDGYQPELENVLTSLH